MSTVVHSITGRPRIARPVQLLVERQQLAALDERQRLLLAEIQSRPGSRWHTRKVRRFHRANKQPSDRRTAMTDLRLLHQLGHLVAHGPDDQRFYTPTEARP